VVYANVTNNYDLFAAFIDNISAELLNRDSVLISEWSADEVVTRRPSTNFVCSTMTNLRVVVRLLPLRHPSSIQLFRVWLLCADSGQCRLMPSCGPNTAASYSGLGLDYWVRSGFSLLVNLTGERRVRPVIQ